jgi:hypothetical protein
LLLLVLEEETILAKEYSQTAYKSRPINPIMADFIYPQ